MIDRKPMGTAVYPHRYRVEDKDFLNGEWLQRFLAVRRAGKIGIVLCEENRYWVATDTVDPWGPTKKPITATELRCMILIAEERAA